jgi:hypothetical protein
VRFTVEPVHADRVRALADGGRRIVPLIRFDDLPIKPGCAPKVASYPVRARHHASQRRRCQLEQERSPVSLDRGDPFADCGVRVTQSAVIGGEAPGGSPPWPRKR